MPTPPAPTTVHLTCHAPHPDPRKSGEPCGQPLGTSSRPLEFVTTAARLPESPTGEWVRCSRCKAWNRFRAANPTSLASLATLPTPPEPALA